MIVCISGKDLTGVLALSRCSFCGSDFETGDLVFFLAGISLVKVCARCEPRQGYVLAGFGVFKDKRYTLDPDPQAPNPPVWRPDTPPEVIARYDEAARMCTHLAVQIGQAAGRPQHLKAPNTVLN